MKEILNSIFDKHNPMTEMSEVETMAKTKKKVFDSGDFIKD